MATKKQKQHVTPQQTYRTFVRYSNITFFLVISTLLAVGTGLLILLVSGIQKTSNGAQPISKDFDQGTIKKLQKLSDDGTSQNAPLPSGRINPFVE